MLWSLADAMEDELRGPRRLRLFGRGGKFRHKFAVVVVGRAVAGKVNLKQPDPDAGNEPSHCCDRPGNRGEFHHRFVQRWSCPRTSTISSRGSAYSRCRFKPCMSGLAQGRDEGPVPRC